MGSSRVERLTGPAALGTRLNGGPVIAFVGVLATTDADVADAAFNRAGQMFVEGLLNGLSAAGLAPNIILGVEPVPAFPRSRRLVGRAGRFTTLGGRPVHLVPFLNVQPLKWLTAGISVGTALVRWAWRHRGRPRLVHCLNISMPPGLFVWFAARLTGTKTLVSVNDVVTPGGVVPHTLFRKLDFALHRWLLPRFDGWMVVSRAIANDFLPGRRVCLIEGGVSPEFFEDVSTDLNVERKQSRRFRIVLAGSLESFNGAELAVESMSHLPEGYELVVAGKGTIAAAVEQAAAQDDRIIYRGLLDFDELLELYRSADLLLNLRVTRAIDTRYFFPSKLMELLASGTPVLSTCTGHVEEEYGAVLYLLREETARAVAERVQTIAGIPAGERHALGVKARAFMLTEKSWKKQGERLAGYVRTEIFPPAVTAGQPEAAHR